MALERDPALALVRADLALEGLGENAERAELDLDRGLALLALGRFREADEAFARATEGLSEPRQKALCAAGRAEALGVLGRHDEARDCGATARTGLEALGDRLGVAWVEVILANIHHQDLDATGVREVFDSARETLLRLGAEIRAARADVSCANALTYQGRHGAALERYRRAEQVFRRAGIDRRAAICDLNRAILHQMRGELHEAVQAGESARAVFQSHGQGSYAAFAETNLSEVLLDLNRDTEALAVASSAADHYRAEGMEHDHAIVAINRARALARGGSVAEARAELRAAGEFFRAEGSRIYAGLVDVDLAVIDLEQGDHAAAATRARGARRTLSAHTPYAAYALLVEARATEAASPGSALKLHQEAASIGARHGLIWLQYRSRHRAAILLAAAGELCRARAEADSAVRLIERARAGLAGDLAKRAFLKDKEEALCSAVRLHLAADDPPAALRAIEAAKSAALADLISTRVECDTTPSDLSADEAKIWTEFARVRGDYSAQISAAAAAEEAGEEAGESAEPMSPLLLAARRTEHLASRYDQLKAELERIGRRDLANLHQIDPIDREGIAALLEPGDRFLELYFLDGRAVGALVAPDGSVETSDCGDERELAERIVEDWHGDVADLGLLDPGARHRHLPAFLDAAQETLDALGESILAPFTTSLRGAERVIVAPHGVLHALPLPALRWEGRSLVEQLETVVVPSGSVLRTLGRRSAATGTGAALVVGAADRDAPLIAAEARRVAELLPGSELLEGAGATTQAFRDRAPRAEALHLACHGEFAGDSPMASALLLADGPLRAADLYAISIGAPLVVLSGCETGRSRVRPGDELLGLLRGFLLAGAEAVVASLWRVDDAASARLMEHLYGALAAGATVAGALRSAQRRLAEDYAHPYFWAGFGCFGRGSTRMLSRRVYPDRRGARPRR